MLDEGAEGVGSHLRRVKEMDPQDVQIYRGKDLWTPERTQFFATNDALECVIAIRA